MKKVGIVVDDYKLTKFKKELTKQGFPNFKTMPFTAKTTSIFIEVEDNEVQKIGGICRLCEIEIKQSN